jgi:hypothetical protein
MGRTDGRIIPRSRLDIGPGRENREASAEVGQKSLLVMYIGVADRNRSVCEMVSGMSQKP